MDTMGRIGLWVAPSLVQVRGITAGDTPIGDGAGAGVDVVGADADFTVAAGMEMAAATDEDGTEVASAAGPVGSVAEAGFTEAVDFTVVAAADSMAAVAMRADIAKQFDSCKHR